MRRTFDLTPAEAKRWAEQEFAKCRTAQERTARLAHERKFAESSEKMGIAATYPNSARGRKLLIEKLDAALRNK